MHDIYLIHLIYSLCLKSVLHAYISYFGRTGL